MSAEVNNIEDVVRDLAEPDVSGVIDVFASSTPSTASQSTTSSDDGRATQVSGQTKQPASPNSERLLQSELNETSHQPRGFQHRFESTPAWPPVGSDGPGFAQPKPLPRRPKGQFIIGATLFIVCAIIANAVWSAFLGVSSYGLVEIDTLQLNAPFEGRIAQYHVSEGQRVRQGQLLATLESPELTRQRERLQDELNLAKSQLSATASKLKWESQAHAAEYFELWGKFLKGREDLLRIERDFARANNIADVVADQELDYLELSANGQRAMLQKMADALRQLRARSTAVNGDLNDKAEEDQLRPAETRIEFLLGEIRRIDEKLEEGRVLSPVDGVIVKRNQSRGQQVSQTTPIVEVVDSGSTRIVMYVQQSDTGEIPVGTQLELRVDPLTKPVEAIVESTRQRFETPPSQIHRYHLNGEPLLPVILKPTRAADAEQLRDGAIVKLTLFSDLFSTDRPGQRKVSEDQRITLNPIDVYQH